jgi:hypothetical protein
LLLTLDATKARYVPLDVAEPDSTGSAIQARSDFEIGDCLGKGVGIGIRLGTPEPETLPDHPDLTRR